MTDPIHARLKPVRRRQQWLLVLNCAAVGLLVGAVGGLIVATCRVAGWRVSAGVPLIAVAAGLGLGLLVGLAWRRSWDGAAAAIDAHYRLKDRAATALAFLRRPNAGDVHELQIRDALSHLDRVDPRAVAPLKLPKALPYAAAALLVAVTLLFVPVGSRTARASLAAPLPQVTAEADRLQEEMIEELEELTKDPDSKELQELKELTEQLKEMLAEMKEPGVDERLAIAKLSEMQAAIAALQQEFNLEAVDAQMQAVGEAIAAAAALKPSGESMQKGNYDKAAEQLEKVDPSELSNKEARSVQEKLAKLAKALEDGKQGELSDALSEMCEGLNDGKPSQCKSGLCKLAGQCRSQSLRKKIGNCLGCQLAKLGECKSNCAGNCNKNGGNKVARTKSPSNNWGTGVSGQPLGDEATRLDGRRNREEITGMAGDGPSEKEVSHSPEGRQEAARSYREAYQKFRKETEAVLESEPLPLGHRQTIRTYFESIRPQGDEASDAILPEPAATP